MSGEGRFIPSNVYNDFTGSWRIVDGGTVSLATTLTGGSSGRLGDPDNPVYLDSGTLVFAGSDAGASNTHHRPMSLGESVGTIVAGSSSGQDPTITWAGDISGEGGLTKESFSISVSLGTLVLSGQNRYTGDTLINAGILVLAEEGALTFAIHPMGTSNRLAGNGTVFLDGELRFELSEPLIANGSWQIIDLMGLTAGFGDTFRVAGFSDDGGGVWTRSEDGIEYQFSQATGTLSASGFGSTISFEAWINGFDLAEEQRAPMASPAADGLSNLLKYALNLNPTISAAGESPMARVEPGGQLTLEAIVRDNDDDLSLTAQASLDLIDWQWTVVESGEVDQSETPVGFRRRIWISETAEEEKSRLFIRLVVDSEE